MLLSTYFLDLAIYIEICCGYDYRNYIQALSRVEVSVVCSVSCGRVAEGRDGSGYNTRE